MLRKLLKRLRPYRAPLLVVSVLLLLTLVATFGLIERAELALYDQWFAVRGALPRDERVVVIAIDDKSIKELRADYGRFPWPRSLYAQLLPHLGEARVVGYDIILSDPYLVPGDDAAFAQAITQHGRVILSAFVESSVAQGGQINQSLSRPTKVLLDAVRTQQGIPPIGVVNTPAGIDSVVRAMIPVDDTTGSPEPSLALAAAMAYQGSTNADLSAPPFEPVTVGDLVIPRNAESHTLLNYRGPAQSYETHSFSDVLKGRVPPSTFKNKIVLIGASATGLNDFYPVPFPDTENVSRNMPGVEIHATAASTFLDGTHFKRMGHGYSLLALWAVGLMIFLVGKARKPWVGAVGTIAVAALYIGGVYALWLTQRLWLDSALQLSGIFLVYLVVTLDSYLKEQAAKRQVQDMFGRYVSHNVVTELLKNPAMAELGGRTYEVTILFSDIRGFTTYSESRDPKDVLQRINEYCKEMVDIIYRNGGTLDKYMGDGIMAYFGAPVPMADHAERAMRCAREMREAMKQLHTKWQAEGVQPFKIGVGLNSGEVVAGNIGHPDRMEYSLIGAAVNLAARLESMTKEYAKSEYGGIVFSEATYAKASRAMVEFQPTDLGEVEVRGMVHPVRIFTI